MIVYCARIRYSNGEERLFYPSVRPSKTQCKRAVANYNSNSGRPLVLLVEVVECDLSEKTVDDGAPAHASGLFGPTPELFAKSQRFGSGVGIAE